MTIADRLTLSMSLDNNLIALSGKIKGGSNLKIRKLNVGEDLKKKLPLFIWMELQISETFKRIY